MPKRLIDLTEADALNNGDDLVYVRQASGSRRDRKITTLALLKGMFSTLGGIIETWTADTMGEAKILARRVVGGVTQHAWIDLTTLFVDLVGPVADSVTLEQNTRENADNALTSAITVEAEARGNAVTAEAEARANADTALSAALAWQQLFVRPFDTLDLFFTEATSAGASGIRAQNRIVHHTTAAGKVAYAELHFHWSATFQDSSSSGWQIPASHGSLGADIDSALRELWGIAWDAEWPYPFLHGTLQVSTKIYPVEIYHQPGTGGSGVVYYNISGWDRGELVNPFGDLRFLIPGSPVL